MILSADIPIMLGLNEMMKMGMDILLSSMALRTKEFGVSIACKEGRPHRESFESEILHAKGEIVDISRSKEELKKSRKRFKRASAKYSRGLMQKAGRDVANEGLQALTEIGRECHAC